MDNALIVGGTSGLGLEIAKLLSTDYKVYVTGRKGILQDNINFKFLDLIDCDLPRQLDNLLVDIPEINLLIYAAGYFQDGKIDDLTDQSIIEMNYVGLIGAELLMGKVMKKQGSLDGFIAITSTSQVTPREREPIYTGVKSGLAMFARSISLDKRIGKTLVAAPAGMNTPFWSSVTRDTSTFLESTWVANEIITNYKDGDYRYSEVHFLRDPPRVELKEKR